jgi:hypothetical protein
MTYLVAFFTVVSRSLNPNAYDARRSVDPSPEHCAITAENCTFAGAVGGMHYRLTFGSTCTLSLTECRIGQCYSLVDWSYERRWAYVPDLRKSAFASFNVTNVNSLHVSSAGVYFRPSQRDVTISFTVHTCDDFYRLHPFTEIENCTTDGPEISALIRGPPMCGEDVIHNPAML